MVRLVLFVWRAIVVIALLASLYTIAIEGWSNIMNDDLNIIIIKLFVLLTIGMLTVAGGYCLLFINKII